MTELPTGWTEAPLGDLVDNRDSARRPINAKERSARPGSVPYFGAAGQVGWIDRPLFDSAILLLGEDGVQFFDPTRPKAYMVSGPSWVNNHAHVLAEREDVSLRYLMHFLNQFDYHGYANGTTRLKLTRSAMDSIPVRLAPAREQQRIVAGIEEAFSKLDAGEASLWTVRQRLKRMRESVLDAAVSGHAVVQDPVDGSAAELLASLCVSFVGKGLYDVPGSWEWARLGDLLREPLRNGMSAVKADPSSGLPTFSITAVTNGDFSNANIKYTAGDWMKAEDLWAMPGDVFVQRSNTPELVGTARRYTGAPRAAIFPDLLIRIRTVPEVRPAWVDFFMRSPVCRRFVRSQARGLAGSMPKIAQPVLEALPIPVPPVAEQDRVIAEVERQLSVLDACERAVDAGLARASALRRSVLKAAFEGRLVPQDASDEAASTLLDRLRSQSRGDGVKSGGRRGRKKIGAS